MTQSNNITKIYIAYGYEDSDNAPIMNTANTLKEAKRESKKAKENWFWYEYDDIQKPNGENYLLNPRALGILD